MVSSFWLGDYAAAERHEEMLSANTYSEEDYRRMLATTNQHPRTVVGIFSSQWTWMLGFPDKAARISNEKDSYARRLGHAFDLGFALGFGSWVFDYRGEPEELFRRADECESVGHESGLKFLVDMQAVRTRARALVRAGRLEEGVAMFGKYFESPMCQPLSQPYNLAVQAEALGLLGRYNEALARLDQAFAQMDRPGWQERSHYAEVLRLKGWMLMRQGKREEAEAQLRASIDCARQQRAKSWELRSSTTLAQLLAERGQRDAARELLRPIYNWFTEGFDTKDLKEAKALLGELI